MEGRYILGVRDDRAVSPRAMKVERRFAWAVARREASTRQRVALCETLLARRACGETCVRKATGIDDSVGDEVGERLTAQAFCDERESLRRIGVVVSLALHDAPHRPSFVGMVLAGTDAMSPGAVLGVPPRQSATEAGQLAVILHRSLG
jgi:hypothetical protein